jgi:hypothetical protein
VRIFERVSGSFTAGQAYRIRLVRDNAILVSFPCRLLLIRAQPCNFCVVVQASSGQFNITSSGAAGSSAATTASASASASGSMSMGGMSSATRSVPTAMTSAGVVSQSASSAPYTGNNQNTGIPPAASVSFKFAVRKIALVWNRSTDVAAFLLLHPYGDTAKRREWSCRDWDEHARTRWSWARLGIPGRRLVGTRMVGSRLSSKTKLGSDNEIKDLRLDNFSRDFRLFLRCNYEQEQLPTSY